MGFLQTDHVIFWGMNIHSAAFWCCTGIVPFGFDPYPCHGSAEEGQERNKSQPTFEIRGFPGSFNFHMLDFWWVLTSVNISPNNDIPDIFCL